MTFLADTNVAVQVRLRWVYRGSKSPIGEVGVDRVVAKYVSFSGKHYEMSDYTLVRGLFNVAA